MIANRGFLPSAPSTLWFLLARKPLLFKPLDKIVFVTKFSNRSQTLLALNLWCLTSYLPGFCKRSVCWHLSRLFNYIIIFIFVCLPLHKAVIPSIMHARWRLWQVLPSISVLKAVLSSIILL